jgi:hypothetical protein
MATYRIVCTDQEPSGHSKQHAHIVAVGIGDDPNKVQRKWALDEVLGQSIVVTCSTPRA